MSREVLLNGRPAAAWEIPLIEHAVRCERERELVLLAGVLTAEPVPLYAGRTVDDLPVLP